MSATELTCLNCDGVIAELRRPYLYCSGFCTDEAEAVRYARAVIADGRILRPDVAEAVEISIGMVLGGGYPRGQRALSKATRAAVFGRDGHVCRVCGVAEAAQIDHINADPELLPRGINDPLNLQAICDPCHREKTLASFVLAGPEEQVKSAVLWSRIKAPLPTRACDDEQNWRNQWRRIVADRTALVRSGTYGRPVSRAFQPDAPICGFGGWVGRTSLKLEPCALVNV